jgi:tetratricopeptide (TPR) repeat protein
MKKIIFSLILAIALSGILAAQDTKSDSLKSKVSREQMMGQAQAFEHFSRGDLYEESGNYEKAADEYRLALVFDPGSDVIKRSLIEIYFGSQQYQDALDLSLALKEPNTADLITAANLYVVLGNQKKAVEYFRLTADSIELPEPPNHFEKINNGGVNQGDVRGNIYYYPNQYLAGYYSEKKDYKKAEYFFRRSIGNDTTGIRGLYRMASFYRDSNQLKKARAIYEQMSRTDSISTTGYLGLASLKEMEADTAGADSIYQVVADKNWEDAQLLAILSQALIRLGDIENGARLAYRVSELNPNDYFGARRLALMLFSLGNYSGCDSVLAALSVEVTDDPILYYYRGRIAQLDSNYLKAENYYSQSLAIEDTLSEVWVSLAFTRFFMGDTNAAAATFDSALIACPPDTLRVLFFTGMFNSQRKQYSTAIGYFDRVLQTDPRNVNALFNLGSACERDGRFADAEKAFERVLIVDPDNAQTLNYLGFMWADRGINLEKAQKMIARALDRDPENGAYLDSYAWVLFKKGKFKEALKYQEKAMQFSAEDAILFDHLGDIQAALKNKDEAKENWRHALELDPGNDIIKQKITK